MRQRVRMLAHKSCVCVSSTSTVSFKMHCVECWTGKKHKAAECCPCSCGGYRSIIHCHAYGVALASCRGGLLGWEVAAWAGSFRFNLEALSVVQVQQLLQSTFDPESEVR